jgi:hypothetical protein
MIACPAPVVRYLYALAYSRGKNDNLLGDAALKLQNIQRPPAARPFDQRFFRILNTALSPNG